MLRCLLVIIVLANCEGRRDNVSCYVGQEKMDNITLEVLKPGMMCSVWHSIETDAYVFEPYPCESTGCHEFDLLRRMSCCCTSHACNTITFFKLATAGHDPSYIGHYVILLIVIAKLLIILIINCRHHILLYDSNPKFEDRIHLDLSQTLIQPKMSSAEVKHVIDSISKEPNNTASVSLSAVKMRAVLTYSTNDRITFREAKEQATLGSIDKTSKMEDILAALIRLGPCEINYDVDVICAILDKAKEVFSQETTLLQLSVPITIYGDIHGQYSDIWRWFHVNGWPTDTRCLFLGDYVDRGRHSTEVLMFVLLLKIVMPKSVFLCRGNHEEPIVNKSYNFYSEIKFRFPNTFKQLYNKIADVFSMMPIACVISDQIICMHGGLSPKIQLVSEIAELQRPLSRNTNSGAHVDIMWSDPHIAKWTFEPNVLRDPAGVGVGYLFGPIQINRFLKKNKLSLIVRGHQPPMSGYERVGKHLITIFSTGGYRTESNVGNMGASLVVDEDGTMDIIRIQVGEQLKLKRQRYKMDKGDSYRNCGKPKLRKQAPSADDKYS